MNCNTVVVVRTAAQCALGSSVAQCVDALRSGALGLTAAACLEQTPKHDRGVGQVPGLSEGADPAMDTHRAERLVSSTLRQLLDSQVCAALHAASERHAVVLGTTLAGMRHCGAGLRAAKAGQDAAAIKEFGCMPAGAVLQRALQGTPLHGPAISVSCACASALNAVLHGAALIQSGAFDCVIAGGYDPVSEFAYGGFAALQLVAAGPISPFAPEREGMKVGEGAALVLLCSADFAGAHGLGCIGFIEAHGESSDGFHLTQPHPEGQGAARALTMAIAHGTPDLLMAHGTGTPANDAAEFQAYRAVFGERLPQVPVSALKSRFGHPLGAAGALELVLALACAEAGMMPAGAGRAPDAAAFAGLDLVHQVSRSASPRRVTALAAGFGGANAAVTVVRDQPPQTPAPVSQVHGPVLLQALGAVSVGGRGLESLCSAGPPPGSSAAGAQALDDVLGPLLDRARTRRLALLPRLMLGAVADLRNSHSIAQDQLAATPVVAASWHGAASFTEQYYRDLLEAGVDLGNPMLFAESVPNIGSAHLSLGLGITAQSCSVIGTRTAGLQALFLACQRIRSGQWSRALVVAADESHPIVDQVLSHCVRADVQSRPGAVALLLTSSSSGVGSIEVAAQPAGASRSVALGARMVTSQSPCDAVTAQPASSHGGTPAPVRVGVPELGCATALGVLGLCASKLAPTQQTEVLCADPCGAAWRAVAASR